MYRSCTKLVQGLHITPKDHYYFSMKSYNEDLYLAFTEIADLMSILDENSFRIRAYYEAARRIKEYHEPITKRDTDKCKLMDIPRVGQAIAEKIIQYLKTGKIDYLETLRRQIQKPVRDMLKIPHLGPRRVRDLYLNLNIKSAKNLLQAAKTGRITELRGFGEKLTKQIVDALTTGQEKKTRHSRAKITPIAKQLIKILTNIRGVKRAEPAGSFRRNARDLGDLDILVVGSAHAAFKAEAEIKRAFPNLTMLASGETKVAFVIFPENLQVDIRFVPPESYGAALLYFTGSKEYNVMMRKVAISKGYLLNEYGLFKNGEYIAGRTEQEVCDKLKLPYKKPVDRK